MRYWHQIVVDFWIRIRKNGGCKMSFKLSNKTKEILSKRIGIPYEKLIHMDGE